MAAATTGVPPLATAVKLYLYVFLLHTFIAMSGHSVLEVY